MPFKVLSEDTSPPLKVGFSDSHSMSLEMESLQHENGNNKWHKTYTRFSTQAKRWSCRRLKPWIVFVAFSLVVAFAVAVLGGLVGYKATISGSFASKQDILELHLPTNESLNLIHRVSNQSNCNKSSAQHSQDQVNAIEKELEIVKRKLRELGHIPQNHIDGVHRNDSLSKQDLNSAHEKINEFTKKSELLEMYVANLSSAQQGLENLFHANMSTLVAQIQNNVSSVRDTQDNILEKILSTQHNISLLDNQLSTIRRNMQQASSTTQDGATLSSRLGQLENKLNILSTQVHNPVNLYENCREDTESCSIDPDHSHTDYWRDCPTKYLPLHKEVR